MSRAGRLSVALGCLAMLPAAWAETPQEFAARIVKTRGVTATVNLREDGSFGSVSMSLAPSLVADAAALDAVSEDIGRHAAAARLRVHVVTPTREDNERIVARLQAAGVATVASRVMAEATSNRMSRVFLTPPAAPQRP